MMVRQRKIQKKLFFSIINLDKRVRKDHILHKAGKYIGFYKRRCKMAKCFITGVELPLEETYVLNISSAHKAFRSLKHRLESVERLIEQLSPVDDVEFYDAKKREMIMKKNRRLVSPIVAKALSTAYPEGNLFFSWTDWLAKRQKIKKLREIKDNSKNAAVKIVNNVVETKTGIPDNWSNNDAVNS